MINRLIVDGSRSTILKREREPCFSLFICEAILMRCHIVGRERERERERERVLSSIMSILSIDDRKKDFSLVDDRSIELRFFHRIVHYS